jgi:hypothetical protein
MTDKTGKTGKESLLSLLLCSLLSLSLCLCAVYILLQCRHNIDIYQIWINECEVVFVSNTHLTQDSCFSPSRVALGSGTWFPVLCVKGRKMGGFALFSFALGAFAFSRTLYFALPSSFFLHACKRESTLERGRPPLFIILPAAILPAAKTWRP